MNGESIDTSRPPLSLSLSPDGEFSRRAVLILSGFPFGVWECKFNLRRSFQIQGLSDSVTYWNNARAKRVRIVFYDRVLRGQPRGKPEGGAAPEVYFYPILIHSIYHLIRSKSLDVLSTSGVQKDFLKEMFMLRARQCNASVTLVKRFSINVQISSQISKIVSTQ